MQPIGIIISNGVYSLHSLEKDSLKLNLKVEDHSYRATTIDVSLVGELYTLNPYSQVPSKQNINIRLYSEYSIFEKISRVYIIDLVGSSTNDETKGRGFGTLLFNTLLQFLKKNYPSNTEVYGKITEDRDDIREFWKRFGFRIITDEVNGIHQRIVSSLSNLETRVSPKLFNNTWKTFIPLEELGKTAHLG